MLIRNRLRLLLKIVFSKKPNKFLQKRYKTYPKTITEYIPSKVYDNKLLADKNVLITGARKNIGKCIAIEMAKQGANIYFTDIDKQSCNELENDLINYEIEFKGFNSDISNTEDTNNVINYLSNQKINIDILVNNVGINSNKARTGTKHFNIEDWRKTYETNVFGPMHLTKKISDNMIKEKIRGSIIFLSSVHQKIVGNWPAYSSSKAALGMIVKELAVEFAKDNIRVNGIAPGGVQTDENKNPVPNKHYKLHGSSIEPQYIGRAAVYLASEYFSRYTTGTILKIDSGHTLLRNKDIHKI